jgi:hypothetical protein
MTHVTCIVDVAGHVFFISGEADYHQQKNKLKHPTLLELVPAVVAAVLCTLCSVLVLAAPCSMSASAPSVLLFRRWLWGNLEQQTTFPRQLE